MRNLAIAGFGVIILFTLVAKSDPVPARQLARPAALTPSSSPTAPKPVSQATTTASFTSPTRSLYTHAVEVSWLNGFPPDAAPGDVFDIWVAWNRAVAKGPNIQLLLQDVTLEKIAPPVTPDGPYVAYLIVTRAEARDLLYGTKYGALSVTQPAG